jgi:hypothetical protein
MRRRPIGDPWLEHHAIPRGPGLPEPAVRAEEILAEARAFAEARRALLQSADAPRHRARIRLGSVLLAFGRRLRRSLPIFRAPASTHEVMGTKH